MKHLHLISFIFFQFSLNYSCNKNSADYMLIIELRSSERIAQAQVQFLVLKSDSKYPTNAGCCCSMLLKTLITVQFDGMSLQDSKHSLSTKIAKNSLEAITFVNCHCYISVLPIMTPIWIPHTQWILQCIHIPVIVYVLLYFYVQM